MQSSYFYKNFGSRIFYGVWYAFTRGKKNVFFTTWFFFCKLKALLDRKKKKNGSTLRCPERRKNPSWSDDISLNGAVCLCCHCAVRMWQTSSFRVLAVRWEVGSSLQVVVCSLLCPREFHLLTSHWEGAAGFVSSRFHSFLFPSFPSSVAMMNSYSVVKSFFTESLRSSSCISISMVFPPFFPFYTSIPSA